MTYGYIHFLNKEFKNWDPDKYNWNFSRLLAMYCSDYFNIWWDPNRFNWYMIRYLDNYCYKYRDKWLKDLDIYICISTLEGTNDINQQIRKEIDDIRSWHNRYKRFAKTRE